MKFRMIKLTVAFVAITFISTLIARADMGHIFLQPGGNLNGQTIDASIYWINVNPGDAISGTIKVETLNIMSSSAIAPLGYTATWGDRVAQVVETNHWIGTGTNYYDINVIKTAPTTPGIYYLPIAYSGTYNIDQVMSATHPAWSEVWNDGNDLGWDWTAEQFQEARNIGNVTTKVGMPDASVSYATDYMGGVNWVGVNVVPEPSTFVVIGMGALSMIFIWRRRNRTNS